MTAERMRWHCDGLESALADRLVVAGPNIHTDDQFARANGLPGRVADGMISTNWLSNILLGAFGDAYLAGGRLRTRYRRPVFVDVPLSAVVRVAELRPGPDGERELVAEVFCETPDGERVTEGEAAVPLP
jgi:3-hydroxybutyryl-CoA dehydratase